MQHHLRRATELVRDGGLGQLGRTVAETAHVRLTDPVFRYYATRLLDATAVVDRASLLESTAADGRLWRFGSEDEFRISHHDEASLPPTFRNLVGDYVDEQSFVCEVTDATILDPGGLTISGEGCVLETAEANRTILRSRLVYSLRANGIRETRRALDRASSHCDEDRPVFSMHWHPTTNYYHWILGHVSKIRALEEYRSKTGNSPVVVANDVSPTWVRESMALMGFDLAACSWRNNGRMHAERVVVPQHRIRYGSDYNPSIEECQFIRERAMSNLGNFERDVDCADKVYISRDDATERRVENEPELFDVLEERGFERYRLTELSVPEQVELFATAQVVVAPHGAGLTNMIFSDELAVVELFPSDDIREMYFCLASLLGHRYDWIECRSSGKDLMVDPESVLETIGQIV